MHYCEPILSVEDIKNVHNAKCELMSVLRSMEGIIHPSLYARFESGIELLNKGLKSVYDQENAAYLAFEEHITDVKNELGGMQSVWSLSEVKDLRALHPWPNHRTLSYSGWGDHVVVHIAGPLWKDLWVAGEEAIQKSGDGHHIFIEAFSQHPSNPTELVLVTGS